MKKKLTVSVTIITNKCDLEVYTTLKPISISHTKEWLNQCV